MTSSNFLDITGGISGKFENFCKSEKLQEGFPGNFRMHFQQIPGRISRILQDEFPGYSRMNFCKILG